MGATLGKCGSAPCVLTTCEALGFICGTAPDGCGNALECGTCNKGLTCCSGQCGNTFEDKSNCGTCGNECDLQNPDEFCCGGECCIP